VLTVRIQRQHNQGRFSSEVLERARSVPGILDAGAASNLPMTGQDWGQNLTVEGRPFRGEQDYIWACHRVVSWDYFRTVGMRVLKGRSFAASEGLSGPRAVVVNETFAKKAWPNEDPIGRRFRIGDYPKHAGEPIAVLGVVADAKYMSLADEAFPEMFFSMEREGPTNGVTFVFRTPGDPFSLIPSVRAIIRSIDPDQPITKVSELETLVAESSAPQRIIVLLGGIFGMLAVTLAGTGLYGVVSYSVAQRRHEIGVRMALGASPASVARLVVLQGLTLTLSGLSLGLAGALALGRLLNSLLFQSSPHDPLVLFAVAIGFAAIALAASFVPARRAAAIDPGSTLRCQ
jgi:putative ABC transport system permease protein